MSFETGQNIGPYRILEQLGQGGMATVYKAYHAALDRYVAVKVLHQAFLEDPNFLARFQREARLVARLEHQNIVPIYDYAEHGGQPYLVMKYVEGETLKARLHREPALSREQVVEIIENVGAGLAYAHKQGILHRDIKPSNVILSKDGGIYLADFGLARIAQSGDSTLTSDMILGTPQYISPEQALGKSDLDQGTDIYSFGVMVYEMTTGRVPFSADTPFSIIHDHIYSPLPLPTEVNPSISLDVERVLLKALAKDRQDRYSDVSSFIKDFTYAIQDPTLTLPGAQQTGDKLPQATTPPVSTVVITDNAPAEPPVATQKKPFRWRWAFLGVPLFLCICCLAIGALNEAGFLGETSEEEQQPIGQVEEISTPQRPNEPQPEQPEQSEAAPIPLSVFSIEQAAQAVEENPDSPIAHVEFGIALIESGQEVEGYDEIQLAAELAQRDPVMLTGLAKALEKRNYWPGALSMYITISETRFKTPFFLDNLRRASYQTAAHPLAPELADLEKVTQIDPVTADLAKARYLVLHEQEYDEARAILEELRKNLDNFPEGALIEAEFLILQDRPDEARPLLFELTERKDAPLWVREQAKAFLGQIP